MGNPAFRSGPRHQPIAIHAKFPVLATLDIKAEVEVAGAAGLFQLGRNDVPVPHVHHQPTTAIGNTHDVAGIYTFPVRTLDQPRGNRLLRQLAQHASADAARPRADAHDHPPLDPDLIDDRYYRRVDESAPYLPARRQRFQIDRPSLAIMDMMCGHVRSRPLRSAQCNQHGSQGGKQGHGVGTKAPLPAGLVTRGNPENADVPPRLNAGLIVRHRLASAGNHLSGCGKDAAL